MCFRHKPGSDLNKQFSSSSTEWIISHSCNLGTTNQNVSGFPAESVTFNVMVALETQASTKWWEQKSMYSLPTETQHKQTNKTCYSLGWSMISSLKNKKYLFQFLLLNSDMDCQVQLHSVGVWLTIISLCKTKPLPRSTNLPLKQLCSFSLFFLFVIHSSS